MLDWKKLQTVLVVFVLTSQLIACATPVTLPIETKPTLDNELIPTLISTETISIPTADISTIPLASSQEVTDQSAYFTPPDFSRLPPPIIQTPSVFDEKDADVYYGLYRVMFGSATPATWTSIQFIEEMQKFSQSQIGVREVSHAYNGHKTGILVNQASQFWAYFDQQGKLTFIEPGLWDPNSVNATWVKRPNIRTHQIEVLDRYIVLRNSKTDKVDYFLNTINANIDNIENIEQWIPVINGLSTMSWSGTEWVKLENKLEPIETEFEGVFSEKYKPSFTDSFVFKDKESGLEIPISIGLTDDLPVKAAHLTKMGEEFLGNFWLLSCYYRYTGTMGNKDVTMDEYLDLVKEGKGQIEVDYFDEISGEEKRALYNPTDGISLTATGNDQMPLSMTPKSFTYQSPYYFTANKDGQFVIVRGLDLHYLDDLEEMCINKSKNLGYCFSDELFRNLSATIEWWAILTPEQFTNKEITDLDPPIFTDFFRTYYRPLLDKLNKRIETKTPFMSVDYLNK